MTQYELSDADIDLIGMALRNSRDQFRKSCSTEPSPAKLSGRRSKANNEHTT